MTPAVPTLDVTCNQTRRKRKRRGGPHETSQIEGFALVLYVDLGTWSTLVVDPLQRRGQGFTSDSQFYSVAERHWREQLCVSVCICLGICVYSWTEGASPLRKKCRRLLEPREAVDLFVVAHDTTVLERANFVLVLQGFYLVALGVRSMCDQTFQYLDREPSCVSVWMYITYYYYTVLKSKINVVLPPSASCSLRSLPSFWSFGHGVGQHNRVCACAGVLRLGGESTRVRALWMLSTSCFTASKTFVAPSHSNARALSFAVVRVNKRFSASQKAWTWSGCAYPLGLEGLGGKGSLSTLFSSTIEAVRESPAVSRKVWSHSPRRSKLVASLTS